MLLSLASRPQTEDHRRQTIEGRTDSLSPANLDFITRAPDLDRDSVTEKRV